MHQIACIHGIFTRIAVIFTENLCAAPIVYSARVLPGNEDVWYVFFGGVKMIIRQAIFRVVLTATTQKTLNSMTRRDRIVFLLLDGKRTIHDIALLIHRTEPDVTGTLVSLLKSGYVVYTGANGAR